MQLIYFELLLNNFDFLSCCVSSSLSALLADKKECHQKDNILSIYIIP